MTAPAKPDRVDRELLQLVQDEFPITKRPWTTLSNKLGITEQEVLSRLRGLYRKEIIQKIAPVLETRKIGFDASTLIAMKVPEGRIEHVANIINEYESVSHNYQREHKYNLWFTITTSNEKEMRRTLEEIKRRTRIPDTDVLDLPVLHRFKIDVRFRFT